MKSNLRLDANANLGKILVMNEQVLRDNRGNRLGVIQTQPDGKLVARDARGNRLGEYDPKQNETRDERGNRVGIGDFLSSLITKSH
jgi:hypothetical protein